MLCCSETCPKSNNCKLHLTNNKENGYIQIGDYSTWGTGIMSNKELRIDFYCGPNGNYRMFKEMNGESIN